MKEEAWKLADYLDNNVEAMLSTEQKHIDEAAKTIRSLIGELNKYKMAWNMAENELEKWKKDLHLQSHVLGFMEGKASQAEEHMMLQQPLSDEEIKKVEQKVDKQYEEELIYRQDEWVYLFARAIEERHGIK